MGKDLKLLIRSRSSALIIILAPLLVIMLVGVAFDNANNFGLSIGVYSSSISPSVQAFLDKLVENEFKIVVYKEEKPCVEDIKAGLIHTCIVFPADLDFDSNEKKEITFYVDYSKINLVWMIMDTVSSRFGSQAREISKNLVNVLVTKLESSQTQLEGKKPVIATMKTAAGEMQATVKGVSDSLTALDLSYNSEAIPIGSAKEAIVQVRDTLSTNLQAAQNKVAAAQSGATGEAADKLKEALTSIESAQSVLNAPTGASLQQIGSHLNTIYTELNKIRDRLEQATTVRGNSVTSAGEVNNKIDRSLKDLATVESTLDAIISDVNSIQVTDPSAVADPITTTIKPITGKSTYLNYLFPSLIILVIMFIAILLGTTLVMMEKHSPAYFRNFITPTRDITFIIATYLTNMLLIIIQMGIILGIAGYFFSAQIVPSLPQIIGILLLAATFFTFLGMVVGYFFTSEETATLGAISIGSIMLFMSSVIIPIESMPPAVRQVAVYNPFVIAERVLREIIMFQPELNTVLDDVTLLLGYSIATFLFIWASQKFMSKHFAQRVLYLHHKRKRADMERKENEHIAARQAAKKHVEMMHAPVTRTPLLQRMLHPLRGRKASVALTPKKDDEETHKALGEELERITRELRKVKGK